MFAAFLVWRRSPAAPMKVESETVRLRQVASVIALVALLVVPSVATEFHLFQATLVITSALALLGLNLLTGYGGQISLGHGALYGIGAYSAAILVEKGGLPYGVGIVGAGLICLVFGFLLGLPALRLEGLYLALATFAFAAALPQVLKYRGLDAVTGGVQGITLRKPQAPFGLVVSPDRWLYFLCLAVAVILFASARNLIQGQTGRAIVAIRDNPIAASSLGINIAMYKTTTFAISAMYAGIAGALGALTVQFVSPDSFPLFLSLSMLVGVVVGGLASISGALFGALFIQFVPNVAEDVSKAAPWAIYGIVLIGVIHLMPNGVAGSLTRLAARYRENSPINRLMEPSRKEHQ
jgi:branched-chain amino acid transport system permease protein